MLHASFSNEKTRLQLLRSGKLCLEEQIAHEFYFYDSIS